MGWLRGNLHAHTTYSDGVKTPQELIAEYEALGYDFLAITDHEDLIGSSYWRAPPPRPPRLPPFLSEEKPPLLQLPPKPAWPLFPRKKTINSNDRMYSSSCITLSPP